VMLDARFRGMLYRLRCRRGGAFLVRHHRFRTVSGLHLLRSGFYRRRTFRVLRFNRLRFRRCGVGQVHFALHRRPRGRVNRFPGRFPGGFGGRFAG